MTVESVESTTAGAPIPAARPIERRSVAALAVLGLAALILAAGALAPPIQETSAPSVSAAVRHETVAAALERGLAPVHPLILDASVEQGPASTPTELGHRATVTFAMLGVPGPTRVKLFVDVGGHWGATPDRHAPELAVWSMLTPMVLLGSPWLFLRIRRRRAERSVPPTA